MLTETLITKTTMKKKTTSYQYNYAYDDEENNEYHKTLYAINNRYQVRPQFNPNNYQHYYQRTPNQQNYQRLQNL